MRKLFIIFLSAAMSLPLYAYDGYSKFSFARQHFEIGFDTGAVFANDLVSRGGIFSEKIVLDMNKIEDSIGDNGAGLYTGFFGDFFITIKSINIGRGEWDFCFSSGSDGSVNLNLPKNLFTLIADGNKNNSVIDGTISVWGAVYADSGFGVSAEYGRLRIGVRPAVFSPLIFIPKSGIDYRLDTRDGVNFTARGDISMYSPFNDDGELRFGSDLSADGKYALFSFLDVGGSITNIPVFAPRLKNRLKYTLVMSEPLEIKGQQLFHGEEIDMPDIDFEEENDSASIQVFRPLRFDAFARYKPLETELLVLRPNVGFTIDINNEETYLNAGLLISANINALFIPYLFTGREEGLWKHRLGFAFNLRAFRLDLEASLQSQGFAASFQMKGFGAGLGISFGW